MGKKRQRKKKVKSRRASVKRAVSRPDYKHPSKGVVRVLDIVSGASIARGQTLSESIRNYFWHLYQELAVQRAEYYPALCESLRAVAKPLNQNLWVRRVSWAYTLMPLSPRGAYRAGGRFNVGKISEVGPGVPGATPFPALYLAEDEDTAKAEALGATKVDRRISQDELILQVSSPSHTVIRVNTSLSTVIDLRQSDSLIPFLSCTRGFRVGELVRALSQKLNWGEPTVIEDPKILMDSILTADWRLSDSLADVPSNSQVFGKIALDAGIQGIIYPSTKTNKSCLAVLPCLTSGFVECVDSSPSEIKVNRLDPSNFGPLTWSTLIE